MEAAWEALCGGASAEARRHFAWQAVLEPHCGEARVGFALAASAQGDLSCGASSIHRALQVDPQVLATMRLDARLVPLVQDLLERYRSRLASRDMKDVESAALCVASLDCLLRGERPAQEPAEPVRRNAGPAARDGGPPRLDEGIASAAPGAESPPADDQGETAPVASLPDQVPSAPPPAAPPRLDVDYDKLREDLGRTAAALDRFNQKLLARIQARLEAAGPPAAPR